MVQEEKYSNSEYYDMTHFCCVVKTGINYEHINKPDLSTAL